MRSYSYKLLAFGVIVLSGVGVWFLGTHWLHDPTVHAGEPLRASNVGFFLLINLLIIAVMVLGFLVSKNLVKLLLHRRRRIFGSKLRSRLVAAFVGLSLVPTVLLFLVSRGILEAVLQAWFSPQIVSAVDGALAVAKYHYDSSEVRLERHMSYLSTELTDLTPFIVSEDADGTQSVVVSRYLERKRREYGLVELSLLDEKGTILAESRDPQFATQEVSVPNPHRGFVTRSIGGNVIIRPEQSINGEFLRGYGPVTRLSGTRFLEGAVSRAPGGEEAEETIESGSLGLGRLSLVATLWISPELNNILTRVITAHDDYRELRTYRRPLASSYNLTLVVVTLMIIFIAIWIGFYLAQSISIPIQQLAEGTAQVAHGNLEFQLPEVGDDELTVLVRSFNTMTGDLKHTTGELVARRQYMEAILANVGVGVISLDREGRVTTCNRAAVEIIGVSGTETVLSEKLSTVVSEPLAGKLGLMLGALYQGTESVHEANVSLTQAGNAMHIQVTATKLVGERGEILGAVILLDNLTELVGAQRMAAWREVARRIAHEIKNPLTPIQLSAQRMQRRFSRERKGRILTGRFRPNEDEEIIADCTETIVSQVETLRTLVNEFSQFARMPKAQPEPVDLNALMSESVAIFREAHPEIVFEVQLDSSLPVVQVDRQQMGQVLINLIDNAVSAVGIAWAESRERVGEPPGVASESPYIGLRTHYESALGVVTLEVVDNGIGIAEDDRTRLFEPYYSTKKEGTGLGLAIVRSIITDHRGFIRVHNNRPHGARFVVELPAETTVI